MSQNCPEKKKKTKGKLKARTLETEESESEDSEPDVKSQALVPASVMSSNTLVLQIKKLSVEDKEEVFSKLFEEGF
jgi:hypothetical protein